MCNRCLHLVIQLARRGGFVWRHLAADDWSLGSLSGGQLSGRLIENTFCFGSGCVVDGADRVAHVVQTVEKGD